MTRFARAKGSKSSNERLPDEATPWHVMKEQLESALSNEQKQPQAKTKSAKELINEKDDLYYAKSLGNTNTDWAEFENSKGKIKNVSEAKVEKKSRNKDKKLKKNLENSNIDTPATTITFEEPANNSETQGTKVKKSKHKNNTENKELQKKTDIPVDSNINQNKNKKKKLKRKKNSDQVPEESASKKQKVDTENPTNSDNKFESSEKLSKRQKRNQKRQNHKFDTTSGNAGVSNGDNSDKNEMNFERNDRHNNYPEKPYNQNFKRNKLDRFGGSIPRKYQKKTAKIRDNNEHKRRKPELQVMRVTINGMDVEIVKYDGFPVKKEDAERLAKLRKEMVLKGIPKPDIDAAMKLERRKCEKALARIRKQVCFHCRKAGHNLSECPELGKEEAATGICFKCGSTEHTHFECKVNKSDDYKFAKCFICREQGHIAKQCPDNPKGLYPDGGGCKICGDVTHLKKDCPDLVKEKEDTAITLDTIKNTNLELLENESSQVKKETKPAKKIVKF